MCKFKLIIFDSPSILMCVCVCVGVCVSVCVCARGGGALVFVTEILEIMQDSPRLTVSNT